MKNLYYVLIIMVVFTVGCQPTRTDKQLAKDLRLDQSVVVVHRYDDEYLQPTEEENELSITDKIVPMIVRSNKGALTLDIKLELIDQEIAIFEGNYLLSIDYEHTTTPNKIVWQLESVKKSNGKALEYWIENELTVRDDGQKLEIHTLIFRNKRHSTKDLPLKTATKVLDFRLLPTPKIAAEISAKTEDEWTHKISKWWESIAEKIPSDRAESNFENNNYRYGVYGWTTVGKFGKKIDKKAMMQAVKVRNVLIVTKGAGAQAENYTMGTFSQKNVEKSPYPYHVYIQLSLDSTTVMPDKVALDY